MAQTQPAQQTPPDELDSQRRRLRLLPRPIRTLSFSSRNTTSSPTTLSSPAHAGTRTTASRNLTTTATTTPPPPSPPSPNPPSLTASPSKPPRRISSKYFRPSTLKRLFTPTIPTITSTHRTPPKPLLEAPSPPQRRQPPPPLTRLREASSSILLTHQRSRLPDKDKAKNPHSEGYSKIPITQLNIETLQMELAEILRNKPHSTNNNNRKNDDNNNIAAAAPAEGERQVTVDDDGVIVRMLGPANVGGR
ncbi:hypothetical protein PRK78_001207 [Emydomyces testavorans]|uniref:Uncharacterized protein n=1 Tax=Emydomyces testavorans TaxID=2070801 RepID=A0AAF0DCX0_9EURO|nr:hypothetical protein PRK78_001207 [Emydomyces testavorans]